MNYNNEIINGNYTYLQYYKELYFRDNLKHVVEDCISGIIKDNDNVDINTILCNIKIKKFISKFGKKQKKIRIEILHPENTYRYSIDVNNKE